VSVIRNHYVQELCCFRDGHAALHSSNSKKMWLGQFFGKCRASPVMNHFAKKRESFGCIFVTVIMCQDLASVSLM